MKVQRLESMGVVSSALLACVIVAGVGAHDVVLFFPAAQPEETTDEYGNVFSTGGR